MSSARNINLNGDSSVKKGGRIVHPVFAKCATKDEIVISESCKQTIGHTNGIKVSTLPLNGRPCSNVGNLDKSQKPLTNSTDKSGYYKHLSDKMTDSTVVSKEDAEHLERNGESKISSSSASVSDRQSSSTITKGKFFFNINAKEKETL
ncbi:uncharacterized protein NPIL_46661 [Nephila pilipes]|uniref:Uncharacterized protein n=1 Tax=Nephila pilipes TaxID=299642 RepID=A0A8X6PM61_NEPPI|nr:uncharacterized protein NPIL_46661 [Nephila pilipes]